MPGLGIRIRRVVKEMDGDPALLSLSNLKDWQREEGFYPAGRLPVFLQDCCDSFRVEPG